MRASLSKLMSNPFQSSVRLGGRLLSAFKSVCPLGCRFLGRPNPLSTPLAFAFKVCQFILSSVCYPREREREGVIERGSGGGEQPVRLAFGHAEC